jgi:hypothetical protein
MNMNPFTSNDLIAEGGQLNLDNWDARRTEDGKVSVIDVVADVTGKTVHYAAKLYHRLLDEERVPKCEMHPLPSRGDSLAGTNCPHQKGRRGGPKWFRPTPVATAAEIVEIIWQLNGTAEFRRNCARTVVRFLGGDEKLVDEIRINRAAQEHLAATNPDHPARLFAEAVDSDRTSSETVEQQKQSVRKLRLENDRLEAQNLSQFMQVLTSIGEEIDDAQRWSVRDRMSNLLRGDGNSQEQETTHASQFLLLDKGLSPALTKRVRVLFGKIAAKLKRRRDHMPFDAKLPTKIKEVDGHPAHVVFYEVPQDLEILEEAYQELIESQLYEEATSPQAKRKGQTRLRF